MVEEKYEERGLSISDLFFLVKKNLLMIIIVTFIFILCGSIYGFGIRKTTYSADATAIVMAENSSTTTSGYQDYLYSNYLINTFKDFIVSDSVIELVKDELKEYGLTKEQIVDSITVGVTTNSLIVRITAKAGSTTLAVKLVNTVLDKAMEAANVMENGEYKYNVLANKLVDMEYAYEATGSRGATTVLVISVLLGLIVSLGIVLIKYLIDDTFTSKDEFERMFKINVLALLQNIQGNGGSKE
ncbi:MAG: Wzz/FepE/Etk N-terminal domain-containing protein [Bacilli bacterium]|nr:Wzz/FepE/Etk N-terminal domain-containing protein [Bacilli bacterium]